MPVPAQDAPLAHADSLGAWASGLKLAPGAGAWDLSIGAEDPAGLEARARIGVGVAANVAFGAEAYAQQSGGQTDVGAVAGIFGRFNL